MLTGIARCLGELTRSSPSNIDIRTSVSIALVLKPRGFSILDGN
jgi:hypothetical protein